MDKAQLIAHYENKPELLEAVTFDLQTNQLIKTYEIQNQERDQTNAPNLR